MNAPDSAGAYLDRAEGAGPLMPKARRLLELRGLLRDALPPELAEACTVANAGRGRIVLYAQNGTVAAKLKLLIPTLHRAFVRRGVEVTAVVVQVQPPAGGQPAPRKEARLSPAAANSLLDLARQLPDSPLKSALESLAARASQGAG